MPTLIMSCANERLSTNEVLEALMHLERSLRISGPQVQVVFWVDDGWTLSRAANEGTTAIKHGGSQKWVETNHQVLYHIYGNDG